PKLPRLSLATTKELVARLERPNGWSRDTAARLLFERQDRTAVPILETLLKSSASSLARMHALYALDGLAALTPKRLSSALNDRDALVREHAVRLAERLPRDGPDTRAVWKKVAALARDPDGRVRYQAAF